MLTYAPSKPVGGRQRRRLEAKRDTAIAHVLLTTPTDRSTSCNRARKGAGRSEG